MMHLHQTILSSHSPLCIICAACGYVLVSASSAHADSVRLHEQAGSRGPAISLNQIAELEGQYADTLGDLVIGRFIDGQDELTVQLATVRRVLTESQANWSDLSLRGRTVCVVSRLHGEDDAAATVANDRALATNNKLAVDQSNAELTVSDLLMHKVLELNQTTLDQLQVTFRGGADEAGWLNRSAAVGRYEVEPLSRSGLGRVPMRVRRFDAAGTVEEVTLTAEVARRAVAVVALRQVRRGEVFNAENIGLQEVLLTADTGETLDSTDLLLGQSAASALREGSVVLTDHVAPDVMVQRGDLVTVVCVSGALVVRSIGRASDNGVKGDIIAVRHPDTRETFYATVTGPRQTTINPASSTGDHSLATTEERR